ncbi:MULTISPECIES: ABC transporter substrate-binding protein [unclassified Beijerinckia]|uniref:ABC transporter substrate-binding protein n=1 Tax=unclassified Beijerinckia TaxID=2638183 RepID=UPI00089657FF|nr:MULTISPECIES: ABC transporter substrate-binding protein [unclassified Beijerinckia]MDH7798973.1 branched-chain amino acid transport system substrate-binding protein [Beijerinckia sp. GAS462]SED85503.1 amino acid/amide ABC transporter substrate-binding protein, HAAT family [Beijerinckia sp. 28-YEA-48]
MTSKITGNGFRMTRRHVMAGAAGLGVSAIGMPAVLRAQNQTLKIGILHPVTGGLAYEGEQSRKGALLALEEINAAGGIKSMGGAKLEAILADAQSKPEVGAAEVDRLAEAGVLAIQGPYASGIALATTQAAAKHNLPHLVDVGVVDQIVTRGLPNTFRFAPGFGKVTSFALEALQKINAAAGSPAKTAVIVHEDGAFGAGMAKLLNEKLPSLGIQVLQTLSHPTPQRDFTNIALQIRQANPDLIIPSNYKNDFILMARTLRQQRVRPKVANYALLGGAASNVAFAKQYPDAAEYMMDCNHWYNPTKELSKAFAKKVAEKGWDLTYEVMLNYSCMRVLADALERAAAPDRARIISALASSTYNDHIMPYGPTKFVNGQNEGAQPANTQILKGNIEVIYPGEFASAKTIFPIPQNG